MRKKHAPEQYAAKPKSLVVKPIATPIEHPAVAVAKQLLGWLDRGGVPPSIILLHGLHFARSRENDGHPVDTYRLHLIMQGTDSKAISEIMDALTLPQANRIRLIAAWLESNWVKKSAVTSRVSLSQNNHQRPPANKPGKPKRKPSGHSPTKPVIVVKKK